MEELFIWFNRTKVPDGYPLKDDFILKHHFNKAKPKDIPAERLKLYNPFKTEFPPVKEYKFPPEIYNIADFPYIYNNQYKSEILPVVNEFRVS